MYQKISKPLLIMRSSSVCSQFSKFKLYADFQMIFHYYDRIQFLSYNPKLINLRLHAVFNSVDAKIVSTPRIEGSKWFLMEIVHNMLLLS